MTIGSEDRALATAAALDASDPLARFVDRFVVDDPELIYLDGNSLGRLPRATAERLAELVRTEWGSGLVRSWEHWIDLPAEVGDRLGAALLGAAPGQVLVADSVTVNLYKLAMAALDRAVATDPARRVLVTDDDNFPTDRYVLAAVAARFGGELRIVPSDPVHGPDPERLAAAVGPDVAVVSLSHVAYRSGAMADMAAVNEMARAAGALTLWDLSHAAGSVMIDLDGTGADLAVGCTYKYLNAGPGAPAYLYVRRDLSDRLASPIPGWFAAADQFAMGPTFDPLGGVGRFAAGTPSMLGVTAVDEGVRLLAEAGIESVRAKGVALTSFLIDLVDDRLAPLGFEVATPRDATRRGAHVSLAHPEAQPICEALIGQAGVVGDFRAPDRLRLGPAPLSTRYAHVAEAIDRVVALVEAGGHLAPEASAGSDH
jgi:kynureninase